MSLARCLGCSAARTGVGYPANHTQLCRERVERDLEKELEAASKVARDRESFTRARYEERARDVRLEDFDQRPDHQVVEGSGALSGGREAKRVRFNVLDGDENDGWVETEEEWMSSPLSPTSQRDRERFHCSHL